MPSQKLFAVSRTFFTYAPIAPGVWRCVVTFSATRVPLPVGSEVELVARVADVPRDAIDEEGRRQDPGRQEHDPERDRADRRSGAHDEHPPGHEDNPGEATGPQALPAQVNNLIAPHARGRPWQ